MKDILFSALSNLLNFLFSKGSMVAAGIVASHLTTMENTQTLSIIIATISAFGTLFQQAVSTTHIRYNTQKVTQTKNYRTTITTIIIALSLPVSVYLYATSQLSATNSALVFILLILNGTSGFKLADATIQKKFLHISSLGTMQGALILLAIFAIIKLELSTELYTLPFLLASALWFTIPSTQLSPSETTTTVNAAVTRTFLPAIFTGIFFLPVIWLLIGDIQARFGDQEAFLLTTANQWRMTVGILPAIFGGYLLLLLTKTGQKDKKYKNSNYTITYYPAVAITVACSVLVGYLDTIYPAEIANNTELKKTIILFMLASVITTLKSSISREMIAAELAKLSIASNLIWAIIFCTLHFFVYHQEGAYGVSKSFLVSQVIHLLLWVPIIIKKELIPKDFIDIKFLASIIPLAWILYANSI